MAETKIIKAVFGAAKSIITQPRYRYDYGQILEVSGITLPESFEARFSNAPTGESVRVLGQNQRVAVPDDLMRTGKSVWCYITVHDAVTDGRTMYTIRIPIKEATERTDAEPTPVQQDIITQAIAVLNDAVTQTGQDVESADASAQAAQDAQTAAESARDAAQASETAASQSEINAAASASSASQSAESAQAFESSARTSATSAAQDADRAEQAAGQSGYMAFWIDSNGDLIYERTSNVDVDFRLVDGDLILEAV
jgi:hypothetical protein